MLGAGVLGFAVREHQEKRGCFRDRYGVLPTCSGCPECWSNR